MLILIIILSFICICEATLMMSYRKELRAADSGVGCLQEELEKQIADNQRVSYDLKGLAKENRDLQVSYSQLQEAKTTADERVRILEAEREKILMIISSNGTL